MGHFCGDIFICNICEDAQIRIVKESDDAADRE